MLSEIELWIRDFEKPPVYWLNGLAGTGKSTIAQTIAERAFADGLLGASFFCSRDFEDRSRLHFILPTLAVQLARVYPQFRSILVSLVQSDPGISHESLYNQMSRLIAQPLMDSAISTVIVIDALDECMDDEPASAILSILGKFVAGLPRVKFIVTGRPDPHIREGFRLPLLVEATNMFVLHQVDPRQVDNDIHRFFRHNFLELTRRRPGLDDWPTEEQLNLLCYRSAGLFAYAVATVKFIDHRSNHPRNQLDRLLRSPERTAFEGKTKFRANTSLYSLYTSILESAFGDNDPSNDPKIRSVLGAVVLATNPLSPFAIAEILNLSTEDVLPILLSVHSLLVLQEDIDHPVRPFHKSFCDFIVDPTGCTNSRFLLRPLDQHEELLIGCLELVNRRLEHNICRLPDAVANSEVDDLRERTRRYIDEGLEYACKSWHKHPIGATSAHPLPARITPVLLHFLEKKFLFWLEALSVLGCVRTAVEALEATTKWLDVCRTPFPVVIFFLEVNSSQIQSSTLEVVRDYSRFVITFFEVISTSATHIYHSALLLSPQTSIIRRLYQQYDRPLARVVRGLPNSWGPIITTAYRDDFGGGATWSPCSRFIALAKSGIIEVLDAVTLQRLGAFDSPPDSRAQRLSFSPDSRLITQSSAKNINTWDLQTGGLASTIIPPQLHESVTNFLSTHSLDGKLVAVANEETFDSEAFITTYNLLPDTHPPVRCVPEGRIIPPIWTHGECLQFATVEQGSITIWEAGFNLVHPPAKAKTLPAPPEAVDGGALLFLPVLFRLAFVLRDTIFVWDATASRFLLKSRLKPASDLVRAPESLHFPHRSTFSSNGQRFAHMDTTGDLYVWKESSPGYVLHQKLTFDTPIECAGPLLSPNGESIIIHTRQEIHLLSTKDEIHSESTYSGQNRFILEFSPDRMSAAFAQMWENTVTILDLQSGEARFSIDAGMEIECVGVNEKMVVVVGEGKIVTWNLLTGNQALSAHMNISNSVRTTMLHHSPLFFNLREFVHTSISPDLTRIVAAGGCTKLSSAGVETYDASTGRCLAGATSITTSCRLTPRFAAGGCEVWALDDYSSVEGWKIVGNREYTDTELVPLEPGSCPPGVFPWQSRSGYEVTGDGWVRGPSKKRLLWLPPHWRSEEGSRTWSERFVGLRHGGLSEVVILEFFE